VEQRFSAAFGFLMDIGFSRCGTCYFLTPVGAFYNSAARDALGILSGYSPRTQTCSLPQR
jgi:hypothetical protein